MSANDNATPMLRLWVPRDSAALAVGADAVADALQSLRPCRRAAGAGAQRLRAGSSGWRRWSRSTCRTVGSPSGR